MNSIILGIETSCDDTSIGIIKTNNNSLSILSHISYDQDDILQKWGGVVPEISSRNHLEKMAPLLKESLQNAKIDMDDIDLIGVTTKPGLLGPLLTGLNCAKTVSLLIQKPIVPVNHLYAHLEAIHIDQEVSYPYLGLLVSGGHSVYFLVRNHNDFTVLGSTIDDAAGEAFDKGGKILGLGYPAGRIIDEKAKLGDPTKYQFPIGLLSSADARLSFSGLKTSLKVFLDKNPDINLELEMNNICASYQNAIVKALMLKLRYALKKCDENFGIKNPPIVLGGGVAANSAIRYALKEKYSNSFFVTPKFCTDNGAMIANYARLSSKDAISFPECLSIDARGKFINKKDQ